MGITLVNPTKVGETVTLVDEYGKHHAALVTAVWGDFYDTAEWTQEQADEWSARMLPPERGFSDEQRAESAARYVGTPHTVPSINVVFVTTDESKTDPYGRQIDRKTSVVHQTLQSAHGLYWF